MQVGTSWWSHGPSRFYDGRVGSYLGGLLPICCPMTSCAWPRGDAVEQVRGPGLLGCPAGTGLGVRFLDEEPGTRGGVDALVDVADVPDDVVLVGVPEPDKEATGPGAGSHPAAAGRTADEHGLLR